MQQEALNQQNRESTTDGGWGINQTMTSMIYAYIIYFLWKIPLHCTLFERTGSIEQGSPLLDVASFHDWSPQHCDLHPDSIHIEAWGWFYIVPADNNKGCFQPICWVNNEGFIMERGHKLSRIQQK